MRLKPFILFILIIFVCIVPASAVFSGWSYHNGCWTATNGTYNYTMWNVSGTYSLDTSQFGISTIDEVVIIGAGSSGGSAYGGAGSSGQVLNYTSLSVSGPLNITIGKGGAQKTTAGNGNNGQNTTFKYGSTLYDASRGGYGGYVGNIGGSAYNGGGSGRSTTIGSYLIGGASYHGGQTGGRGLFTSDGYFAGGSGASQYSSGTDGSRPSANGAQGGDAPDGVVTWILGFPWWIAGPGGGGIDAAPGTGSRGGFGGRGGGGDGGKYPAHGQPGTEPGAGGGGGGDFGGAGMDGAVIIKYSTSTNTVPDSISNLASVNSTCQNITWSWSNPSGLMDHVTIYQNDVFLKNVTNATTSDTWGSLLPSTSYTFSSYTVGLSGERNNSWVNNTGISGSACPTPTPTPTPTAAIPIYSTQWCGIQNLYFSDIRNDATPFGTLLNFATGSYNADENITVSAGDKPKYIDGYLSPVGSPGNTFLLAGLRQYNIYGYVSSVSQPSYYTFNVSIKHANGSYSNFYNVTSTAISSTAATMDKSYVVSSQNTTISSTDQILIEIYGYTTRASPTTIHFLNGGSTTASYVQSGYFNCNIQTGTLQDHSPVAVTNPYYVVYMWVRTAVINPIINQVRS